MRHKAGLVCRWWSRVLLLRSAWSGLDVRDDTCRKAGLCRFRFNMYAEDQVEVRSRRRLHEA